MRNAGRSAAYVFGVWTAITVACGLASLAGFAVFDTFSPFIVAATTAVAAGGMLAMIVDTMIPEAYARGPRMVSPVRGPGISGFVHTY